MLMPELNLDAANLTADERKIAERALNKGRLRASKPNKEEIYEYNGGRYRRNVYGEAAYVWRMLCFNLVAAHPHCCLPMTADWGVGDVSMSTEDRRKRCKELDVIVDKIVATVPTHKKGGLMRWSQALYGELPPGVKEELPGLTYAPVTPTE